MVCVDFKDTAKLVQESQQGAQMGFTGKQAIHPAQVQPIYDAFKPPAVRTPSDVALISVYQNAHTHT